MISNLGKIHNKYDSEKRPHSRKASVEDSTSIPMTLMDDYLVGGKPAYRHKTLLVSKFEESTPKPKAETLEWENITLANNIAG